MGIKRFIKNKWEDIDLYFLNVWHSICQKYYGVKRWFAYFKTTVNTQDFDYNSILEVEYLQLKRVRDCIKKYHSHVDADRDLEKMNIALKLLEMLKNEEYGVLDVIEGSDDPLGKRTYVCTKYVNTRNAKRFVSDVFVQSFRKSEIKNFYKAELYEEKVWRLYNKIRLEYMKTWWD